MKKLWFYRLSSFFAAVAFMVVSSNVNVACTIACHQPKLPTQAEKLKKYK